MESGARDENDNDRSDCRRGHPRLSSRKNISRMSRSERSRQLDHVLVIDDGSTDATARTRARRGAEVIVHPQNRGKGESIKTGLRHWLEREASNTSLFSMLTASICRKRSAAFSPPRPRTAPDFSSARG